MIIVLPTTTGVLVGIDPGTLIKPKNRKSARITADDYHRFQTMRRYVDHSPKSAAAQASQN